MNVAARVIVDWSWHNCISAWWGLISILKSQPPFPFPSSHGEVMYIMSTFAIYVWSMFSSWSRIIQDSKWKLRVITRFSKSCVCVCVCGSTSQESDTTIYVSVGGGWRMHNKARGGVSWLWFDRCYTK